MPKPVSIYELIKGHRYELSIFSTFSVNFSFYEEVLLRHLIANGCHRNILIADAAQCAAAFVDRTSRPRKAGIDYYLLPIRQSTAFHPKIVALFGRASCFTFVGSHNLTMQGFGINRELTNLFEYGREKDKQSVFRDVLEFLSDWTEDSRGVLRDPITTIAARVSPWLNGVSAANEEFTFLGNARRGPSLWSKLRSLLPARIERVKIVGPFFDQQLGFLKEVLSTLRPKDFIVGIDPETVEITAKAKDLLPTARFVDATQLRDSKGYLHAKILLLETKNNDFLITGSANPSHPAWLDSGEDANAEAVVLRILPHGSSAVTDLGIRRLNQAPEVSTETWAQIARRKVKRDDEGKSSAVFSAVETKEGFEILNPIGKVPSGVAMLDSDGIQLAAFPTERNEWPRINVPALGLRSATCTLELKVRSNTIGYACVHHPRQLQAGNRAVQKELRHYLGNLESSQPDITNLLALVQKVIFDQPIELAESSRTASRSKKAKAKEAAAELSTFSVDLAELKKQQLQQELVSTGDLGAILDVLIRILGRGLSSLATNSAEPSKNEEELINSEDEEILTSIIVPDSKLAEACERKVGTLYTRMLKRMELAAGNSAEALRSICQLAAVLSTVYVLRTSAAKAAWVPRGYRLVPLERSRDFLHGASKLLYGSQGLIASLDEYLYAQGCAELSQARALMLWLAWDCKMDVRQIRPHEDYEIVDEDPRDLHCLLQLSPDMLPDDDARAQAVQAICPNGIHDGAADWLKSHLNWAKAVLRVKANPQKAKVNRLPLAGDIVYRNIGADPTLTVVVESYQDKVVLADNEDKKYKVNFVSVVDLPSVQAQAKTAGGGLHH